MVIRYILLLILSLFSLNAMSQWTRVGLGSNGYPYGGRFDDIFFTQWNNGWICRNDGSIYNSKDGGDSWTLQARMPKYLRCIEFANDSLGFCGSLDKDFYMTTDGGTNWVDISNNLPQNVPGICGLSIPDENTVYGVGIWTAPAYMIKSTDGGNSWIHKDMAPWAHKLIDVHFVNADTGFVIGTANPDSLGAAILYTEDGGDNWVVKHHTNYPMENAWKIQTPDGKNMFVSLEFGPTSPPVRILKSTDYGNTWNDVTVDTGLAYIQMVGFIDSLHGWTGYEHAFYETTDGGTSWTLQPWGDRFNRFFKISDSVAYLSSTAIHRFGPAYVSSLPNHYFDQAEVHDFRVSPNPASDELNINLKLSSAGFANIEVWTRDGRFFQRVHNARLGEEDKKFKVSLSEAPPGILYIVLKTNEGNIVRKVVHQSGK